MRAQLVHPTGESPAAPSAAPQSLVYTQTWQFPGVLEILFGNAKCSSLRRLDEFAIAVYQEWSRGPPHSSNAIWVTSARLPDLLASV